MFARFDVTTEESDLITKIVERAHKELFEPHDVQQERITTEMDLCACHANGCHLDLQWLLDAPTFEFGHDILGIRRHMNRKTGQLENCFRPRACRQPTPIKEQA